MSEKNLQNKIVMWFSQTYPQYRGMLFLVNNTTMSERHGQSQRALGLVKGASDLIFMSPFGRVAGIEVKAAGSTHSKDHIDQQIEWGKSLIESNGFYIMSCSEIQLRQFINSLIYKDYKIVEALQNQSISYAEGQSGKTVKF